MNSTAAAAAAAAAVVGCRPPFTASQWEELENQALIFKYLISGIPVPPDLLLPIRRSYESMPARFYSHPALGYCSYYGKKLDPEPGRCRRTDGKKWRCSKDAYPDSKYCERHMHRGRNRSRKLVESQQALPQPPSSSSTATSLATSSSVSSGSGTSGSFHALPFHSFSAAPISSRIHIDPASYGVSSAAKDYRYLHASKPEMDKQHSLFSETSGNARGLTMDSSLDSSWRLMPSPAPSFPLSKERDDSFLHGSSHLQVQPMQELGQVAGSSLHQFSFLESEFSSLEPPIRTAQPLRPFFDEWPRTRDSWSDIEDERSNRTSFSTTQLSISIPMASSDFSTTSSRSPNED